MIPVTSDRWNNLQSYGKDDDSYEEVQLFRTKSYPEDPFLSELVSFRKKHSEPKLKGPMWIDANIEVKIGDMGNATWVVSFRHNTVKIVVFFSRITNTIRLFKLGNIVRWR